MYCQICNAHNREEAEHCHNCSHKLLVVSGSYSDEDQEAFESRPEEQFSFDEHLLERISILEEVVKRTASSGRQTLQTIYKLEQKLLASETGILALRDLLEGKQVIGRQEWSELWEGRMDQQLLALEKRERFSVVKERIAGLYSGEQREPFGHLLADAEYALLGLDIEAAVQVLEEAFKLDPRNYELAFFLGETFFNESQANVALAYFTRVLAVRSNHFESLVYSGVLCHEQGHDDRAEELLRRAVTLYPEAFLPAFSLGAVNASRGRLPQAIVFLEKAVETGEAIPQAFFLLGNCYYEMGKPTPAIRYLQKAVALDPSFEEAHQVLGLAYLDRKWHRKAQNAFRIAQSLRPQHLNYHELVQFLGDQEGRLPELHPEAVDWLRQAEDLLRSGDSQEALAAYRRALGFDPENPTLLVAYSMACLELHRVHEIESVLSKVLGMEPDERLAATAYATLIESLRASGKFREGNRIGRQMLEEVTSDFGRTVAYYEMACNLAEIEQDLDLALTYAQQSVELAPEELKRFPLAALGWVHFKRQEYQAAVQFLRQSNELGSSARTLTHLSMAELAAGERDQARDTMLEARGFRSGPGGLQDKVLAALKDGTRMLQESVMSDS